MTRKRGGIPGPRWACRLRGETVAYEGPGKGWGEIREEGGKRNAPFSYRFFKQAKETRPGGGALRARHPPWAGRSFAKLNTNDLVIGDRSGCDIKHQGISLSETVRLDVNFAFEIIANAFARHTPGEDPPEIGKREPWQ